LSNSSFRAKEARKDEIKEKLRSIKAQEIKWMGASGSEKENNEAVDE
jgi:hypothetical protein